MAKKKEKKRQIFNFKVSMPVLLTKNKIQNITKNDKKKPKNL